MTDRSAARSGRTFRTFPPEPNWLFSNRSAWYPQNQVSDYATATIRFSVPAEYTVVASGVHASGSPTRALGRTVTQPRATYIYTAATQPVRYLGVVVSKFYARRCGDSGARHRSAKPSDADADPRTGRCVPVDRAAEIPWRLRSKPIGVSRSAAASIVGTAADILRLYSSLGRRHAVRRHDDGDGRARAAGWPQPRLLCRPQQPVADHAVPVSQRSGGLLELSGVLHRARARPSVVGTGGRLEELSRAVAERRVRAVLRGALCQGAARRADVPRCAPPVPPLGDGSNRIRARCIWGIASATSRATAGSFERSSTTKAPRCCTCCGGLIGDDAFFRGVKRYYAENRYQKAGTEDLQRAMEAEFGGSLDRFFERWIFASGLPRVRYSTAVEGQELVVRFEQIGDVFDVPVTVTMQYGDKSVDSIVVLSQATTETPHSARGPAAKRRDQRRQRRAGHVRTPLRISADCIGHPSQVLGFATPRGTLRTSVTT